MAVKYKAVQYLIVPTSRNFLFSLGNKYNFNLHFTNKQRYPFTEHLILSTMSDQVHDKTSAGTADDNIPTQNNPMDNIHGTTEDISNKASGYKVYYLSPHT